VLWDENFQKYADCSGRSVKGVHEDAYNEKHRASDKTAVADATAAKNANMDFCKDIADQDGIASTGGPTKKQKV